VLRIASVNKTGGAGRSMPVGEQFGKQGRIGEGGGAILRHFALFDGGQQADSTFAYR